MQIAKCPECNARIGGENHNLLGDNKQVDQASISLPGYITESTILPSGYDINRVSKLSCAILRYITHTVMLTHVEVYMSPISLPAEGSALKPKSHMPALMFPKSAPGAISYERISDELKTRLANDWKVMSNLLQMEDEDIGMGLHMVLKRVSGQAAYEEDMSTFGRGMTDREFALQLQGTPLAPKTKTLAMPPSNMTPIARLAT